MQNTIQDVLLQATQSLLSEIGASVAIPDIEIQSPKQREFGDLASNIALVLGKRLKTNPLVLAEKIASNLQGSPLIASVSVAAPGFINLTLANSVLHQTVADIHAKGSHFGYNKSGQQKKVIVEFVSANPTGPLHVGHGRGAAFGASLSNLLEVCGYRPHREYYVNDAGRQMHILGTSCYLRYLELLNVKVPFPKNAYQGDYVADIAKSILNEFGDIFAYPIERVLENVPPDETAEGVGDKEAHIDAVIQNCKALLKEHYLIFFKRTLNTILDDIRNDLDEFGVHYDEWFSEQSLVDKGENSASLQYLEKLGFLYKESGALWFKSTLFGDEKDRVVVRENGEYTYFASDIAYHYNKIQRGFDYIVDIFGADHHGYVPRVRAAMEAMTQNHDHSKFDEKFIHILVQFAILYRSNERVQMSTRSGSFVTLRSLREEVGNDAARFFYVLRKCDQHMDFDLELAKKHSQDNPVFYVQYAHARVHSVLRQAAEQDSHWKVSNGLSHLDKLTLPEERALLLKLRLYEALLIKSAEAFEVHSIAFYLIELATEFHRYYNSHQFLVADHALKEARLALIFSVAQVLSNGLSILGVSAPTHM